MQCKADNSRVGVIGGVAVPVAGPIAVSVAVSVAPLVALPTAAPIASPVAAPTAVSAAVPVALPAASPVAVSVALLIALSVAPPTALPIALPIALSTALPVARPAALSAAGSTAMKAAARYHQKMWKKRERCLRFYVVTKSVFMPEKGDTAMKSDYQQEQEVARRRQERREPWLCPTWSVRAIAEQAGGGPQGTRPLHFITSLNSRGCARPLHSARWTRKSEVKGQMSKVKMPRGGNCREPGGLGIEAR